jgi:hypothetical protein
MPATRLFAEEGARVVLFDFSPETAAPPSPD